MVTVSFVLESLVCSLREGQVVSSLSVVSLRGSTEAVRAEVLTIRLGHAGVTRYLRHWYYFLELLKTTLLGFRLVQVHRALQGYRHIPPGVMRLLHL